MNERLLITLCTGASAIGAYLYIYRSLSAQWRPLGVSTLLLCSALLIYYHYFIYSPSHGIGIILLPLATVWLVWRKETTGKPDISPTAFILVQIVFSILFMVIVHLQEA